ncbi:MULTISPECIES: GTPase [unclassified Microcoleus]|uniref:GTPase n=1 Tax=unclassified Microcoleus TaxID=2642155 RepID=UPI0025CF3EC1|nr:MULTISPECIES: GTPase [unclassified Microcoleus]
MVSIFTQGNYHPFIFRNGEQAGSPEQLVKICERIPQDGIYFLLREDFEKWLKYINQDDFAQIAVAARLAFKSDKDRIEQFIRDSYVVFSEETPATTLGTDQFSQIQERAKDRGFSFLLVGRTGVGKSSTINSLMGREVAPVGEFEAETKVVKAYTSPTSATIPYVVYDTPGLCDADGSNAKYLELINSKITEPIDCLWFVTLLDDNRVRTDEIDTIRHTTTAFGKDIWKRAVIIFTRADKVEPENFSRYLTERTRLLHEEIARSAGKEIASTIPSVAVSNKLPRTPDGKLWLGRLFVKTFVRISEEGLDGFLFEITNWRGLKIDESRSKTTSPEEDSQPRQDKQPRQDNYIHSSVHVHLSESNSKTAHRELPEDFSEARPPAIEVTQDDIDDTPEFVPRAKSWFSKVAEGAAKGAEIGEKVGLAVGTVVDRLTGSNLGKEVAASVGFVAGGIVGTAIGALRGLFGR